MGYALKGLRKLHQRFKDMSDEEFERLYVEATVNYHWVITLSLMGEFPELKKTVEDLLLEQIKKYLER